MNKRKQKTKNEKVMREFARNWILLFLEQKGYSHLIGKSKKVTKSSVDINPLSNFLKNNDKGK